MKKILIVDDEKLARDRIRSFLDKHDDKFSVLEAANGLSALEILRSQEVDILFLDIQMPELSGMEVLGQLESRPFQVIFQTAFDEYAVQAFEANACDYLLKPFSQERFEAALDRAQKRINGGSQLRKVESSLQARDGFLTKICVKQGVKSLLVPIAEVLGFLSQDHYTTVLTATNEYLIDLSLNHLEERLDPARFQRLHRNNILALDCIKAVIGGENMQVELSNGSRFPVSRNNRKKVKLAGTK
jgi:two-component system LytT family response regulator